ncbi:1417_t:CDS:2, partial [Dentiscutata heterogama]
MSLENKPVKELKKPLQQKLETVLSKPHSKQWQQKLTRDITSQAYDSYLGITCHWISEEFKMYDFTLSVTKIGEYKTAYNIVSTIELVLEEF